jgi:DNA-binding HxlR family transcriptional regulator
MEEGTSKSVGHIRGTVDGCPSDDLACEVRRILDRIADKWSLLVIARLGQSTLRFSELRRQIDGVSQRMLTLTLRNLERDGLVSRTVYPVVPPRVEYRLTSLGETLIDTIRSLVAWTSDHQDEIRAARDAYDAAEAASATA